MSNRPLIKAINGSMIKEVPRYGNSFWYSLGFLSMISFVLLLVSGVIMTFFGPTWWLTSGVGKYLRSVHLWSTQAFVLFIILHLLVVFFTSGFKKPRRLTWVLGVLMLFVVLAETEFGYVLRGDFSSQWRALQGADFYNGSGLGGWINPLNYKQLYGIHIVVVPLVILGLLSLHYLLVRVLGIAKPYRAEVVAPTVPANHSKLFIRGGVLIGLVLVLAIALPSPYIKPTTVQSVAQQDPFLFGKTIIAEVNGTSDTATYLDTIDPYTYSTKDVYVGIPYVQYSKTQALKADNWTIFSNESSQLQQQQLTAADTYYGQARPGSGRMPVSPLMSVVATLTTMAQAGLYEPAVAAQNSGNSQADESTYTTRFLADTGVLEETASAHNITTEQYGMVREETGQAPGAWWLTPIGLLNHTVLASDDNGDRDAGIIFGSLLLTMLAFPFLPYVNQLPDKLKVYKLIWHQPKK